MSDDMRPNDEPTTNPRQRPRSRTMLTWLSGGVVGFALSAALIGGAAFAQSDTSATDYGQAFIDNLAENLGISSAELETAIDEAGTATVDEALTNGDLTEEQAAEMKERIESADGPGRFGFGFGFRMDGPGFGHMRGQGMFGHHIGIETLAETLGITEDELRAELEAGATLEEVITSNGSTVAEVVDALVAEMQTKLDEAVADGRITQERADEILANLPDRLTEMIENGLPGPGFRLDRWSDDSDSDTEASPDADAEETSSEA